MLNGCESLSEAFAKLVTARVLSVTSPTVLQIPQRGQQEALEQVPKDDGHERKAMPNDKQSWLVPTCFFFVV